MATLVEELVLRLDLDPKKFTEGQKKAMESLTKMQQASMLHAKSIEEDGSKIENVFALLSRKVLTFGSLLVGGHGLESFTAHVIQSDAAVGRCSRTFGMSANELKTWQLAAEAAGGSVEDITGTIENLNEEINSFRFTGQSSLLPLLNALPKPVGLLKGPNNPKTATEVALEIAENFKTMNPRDQAFFASQFHMSPATMAMFAQGRAGMSAQLGAAGARNRLTPEDARNAQALQTAWFKATQSIEGMGAALVRLEEHAGAFTAFLNKIDSVFSHLSSFVRHLTPGEDNPESKRVGYARGVISRLLGRFGINVPGGGSDFNDRFGSWGGSNTDQMSAFMASIAAIESGGNYNKLGPMTRSGDRAYGKYQVMGANIPEWTKGALGRSMTAEEFLADPAAQDAVFRHRFGSYVSQYGNLKDAASMWFTGTTATKGAGRRDVLGTSGAGYVDQFLNGLPAGMRGASGGNVSNTDVRIGTINVQTQASDAQGIAKDLRPVIERRQTVTQTNTGLE